nr:aminomethyl-transferring glycine dehydrogenase subunit GcvPA [Candidatus Njordarchaeum guaymaensis]
MPFRKNDEKFVHPYIPNSVPEVRAKMLQEIGVKDIEELYEGIPENLRFKGRLNLPEPLLSEYALRSHVEKILSNNMTCKENTSFLGGGCWQHYVPAVCDEINQRSEFLTAYAGEPYEDHGRFQALFEYESLMAELLEMDVVNVPTYDWCQAASTSLRMAGRITGRKEVLIVDTVSPERLSAMKSYCRPVMTVQMINHRTQTGLIEINDLESKISSDTACVYIENPSYLGFIETQGKAISNIVHENRALSVVGVDPTSLGVIVPPSTYGADIVCGDIQGLGIHMNYGGGLGGFIATRDEKEFVMEYPFRLFGITKTSVEGEHGFGDVAYERTSFAKREEGKEFVGTMAALWGITAGVYLSLMGPKGMQELGKTIMQKSQYAMTKLSEIKGLKAPKFRSPHFKEFVVDFNDTEMTVEKINKSLLQNGIFGGKDISTEFPQLGNCALYCVTEIHTKEDIDKLVETLSSFLQ